MRDGQGAEHIEQLTATQYNLARCLVQMGDLREARAIFRDVLEMVKTTWGSEHELFHDVKQALARLDEKLPPDS